MTLLTLPHRSIGYKMGAAYRIVACLFAFGLLSLSVYAQFDPDDYIDYDSLLDEPRIENREFGGVTTRQVISSIFINLVPVGVMKEKSPSLKIGVSQYEHSVSHDGNLVDAKSAGNALYFSYNYMYSKQIIFFVSAIKILGTGEMNTIIVPHTIISPDSRYKSTISDSGLYLSGNVAFNYDLGPFSALLYGGLGRARIESNAHMRFEFEIGTRKGHKGKRSDYYSWDETIVNTGIAIKYTFFDDYRVYYINSFSKPLVKAHLERTDKDLTDGTVVHKKVDLKSPGLIANGVGIGYLPYKLHFKYVYTFTDSEADEKDQKIALNLFSLSYTHQF